MSFPSLLMAYTKKASLMVNIFCLCYQKINDFNFSKFELTWSVKMLCSSKIDPYATVK